jgi:hypothetical protein
MTEANGLLHDYCYEIYCELRLSSNLKYWILKPNVFCFRPAAELAEQIAFYLRRLFDIITADCSADVCRKHRMKCMARRRFLIAYVCARRCA